MSTSKNSVLQPVPYKPWLASGLRGIKCTYQLYRWPRTGRRVCTLHCRLTCRRVYTCFKRGMKLLKNSRKSSAAQGQDWDDLTWHPCSWERPKSTLQLEEGMATHSRILAWRFPMDRGAWWATLHGVAESWTRLSEQHSTLYIWANNVMRPLEKLIWF